nr:hypothetical protein [Tanacetum cinerariifolium]
MGKRDYPMGFLRGFMWKKRRKNGIVIENRNHLNEPNEAILEVNPVVPEPNQVADIHDRNEMVDILDDIDLVDYDKEDPEEDPEEEPKEEPEEDVNIELEDDAQLIFPYEVEGEKTLPPRDVSSDLVSFESESEDEEVDVAPEATAETTTQKPYAIRDFPRDLEASRARARVMEAKLGPCQTEIALLKSKDKIKKKERELLNHDLENVERALGNVLERMSVFESGENATLKKRLAETETKVVLKPISDDEDTKRSRKKSKNSTSDGTEGPFEPRGPPTMSEARMHEIIRDQVTTSMAEFVANINRGTGGAEASGAGAGGAGADGAGADGAGVGGAGPTAPEITRIASMGIDAVNGTSWTEVKVEQYIRGLSKNIRGDVTSSRLVGINEVVRMAYQLMGKIIQDKADEKCGKCGKLGHKTAACWSLDIKNVTCFNCNEKGHRKKDCPKLKKNGQGGNNRGAVYKLRAVDAQQDPKVVTELDTSYDVELADGKVKKVRIPLQGKTLVIEGNRNNSRLKIVSCIKARKYIYNGCELFLAQVTKQVLNLKRLEDVPVIQDFPEVFPEELPRLPPPRQVEFRIDLIPGVAPVARAPYRLAPSKMKKLSDQLKELSKKGFIRPSSSLWEASANVVADALSGKDKEPIRVRTLAVAPFEVRSDGTKCLKGRVETDTQEKDKNKAKNDKTEHKMEKIEKDKVIRSRKVKSQSPRSTEVNPEKVKVNPDKAKAEK